VGNSCTRRGVVLPRAMSWRSGRAREQAIKSSGSRPISDKLAEHLGTREPTLLDGGWPAATMQRPASQRVGTMRRQQAARFTVDTVSLLRRLTAAGPRSMQAPRLGRPCRVCLICRKGRVLHGLTPASSGSCLPSLRTVALAWTQARAAGAVWGCAMRLQCAACSGRRASERQGVQGPLPSAPGPRRPTARAS